MSLYARLAALLAVVVLLAGIGWRLDQNGYKRSESERTAEKLAATENARLREQAAQKSNERVDRDYQKQKSIDRANAVAAADSLRDFQAASADTATEPSSGADDPYRAIANQCAASLVILDEYAQGVASKATALQGYAREVCLK